MDPEYTESFKKYLKLLSPLLKAWKTALKEEDAIDFSGLLHQAINLIEKGVSLAHGNIFLLMSSKIFHH